MEEALNLLIKVDQIKSDIIVATGFVGECLCALSGTLWTVTTYCGLVTINQSSIMLLAWFMHKRVTAEKH